MDPSRPPSPATMPALSSPPPVKSQPPSFVYLPPPPGLRDGEARGTEGDADAGDEFMSHEAGEDHVAGGDDVDDEDEPLCMLGTQLVLVEEALEDGDGAVDGE